MYLHGGTVCKNFQWKGRYLILQWKPRIIAGRGRYHNPFSAQRFMWILPQQARPTVKARPLRCRYAMAAKRNRPQWTGTLAKDVVAYLDQPQINGSRLVEHAIRQTVSDEKIREAAQATGMDEDDIREARTR